MELAELEIINLRDTALPFALSTSEDDTISVLTENEIHTLKLAPFLQSIDARTNFLKLTIKPRDEYPVKPFLQDLPKFLLGESKPNVFSAINDLVIVPDGKEVLDTSETPARCSQCCWSPAGVLPGRQCAILFLSSVGNVDIQRNQGPFWAVIFDLTKIYGCTFNIGRISSFDDMKNWAYRLATSCMDWSPFHESTWSYIILGQINGDILIWKIANFGEDPFLNPPCLVAIFSASSARLTTIHWIKVGDNACIIISTDLTGQIKGHLITNLEDIQPISIDYWSDEDEIRVEKILSEKVESNFLILTVKKSFILTFLISETGALIDSKIHRVGNIAITGIQSSYPLNYELCTATCLLANFRITISNDKIISTNLAESKFNLVSNHVSTTGICCSKQKAIWFICTNYCKPINHLIIREPIQLILCYNPQVSVQMKLLSNPTQRLTEYWDCMELYKLISDLKVDGIDPTVSLYKLKVFMWFAVMNYNILKKRKKTIENVTPNELITSIKIKYCMQRLAEMMDFNELSEFQRISIRCMVDFLTETSKLASFKQWFDGYEKLLAKTTPLASEEQIICSLCDESVYNGKCGNGHAELLCIISFVPITSIRFPVCPNCGSPAHPDVESPMCTLCDLPMIYQKDTYISNINNL